MPMVLATVFNAAIAAAGAVMAVRIALLMMRDLVAWFSERFNLLKTDKAKLAVTVQQSISEGNFELVQGIFDPIENEFVDLRKITAKAVANEVTEIHRVHSVAVWR